MVAALLLWVWKMWPVIVVAAIGLAHITVLQIFPGQAILVNKDASITLQLIGGILVLYSINENLGTFRNKNLWQSFLEWLRSCPIGSRPVSHTMQGNVRISFGGSAKMSFERASTTIEERMARLEKEVAEVRNWANELNQKTNLRLDQMKAQLNSDLSTQQAAIKHLSTQVDQSLVGGFKLQAFGVLLMVYGALLPTFT